jgi:hypothetical protein
MRVLIACEESQIVCEAFRKFGHEAYSCDLLETSGSHPEWHIKEDVIKVLNDNWDLMIAHPPCDHLSVSGARWFAEKRKDGRQQRAINFFMDMVNAPISRIAVENPICIMSTFYNKPTQIIQPWQFGHGETKATCLWLKNLPKLYPTNIVLGREQKTWLLPPSKDRKRLRSKTFKGIAEAMACQWGKLKDG